MGPSENSEIYFSINPSFSFGKMLFNVNILIFSIRTIVEATAQIVSRLMFCTAVSNKYKRCAVLLSQSKM